MLMNILAKLGCVEWLHSTIHRASKAKAYDIADMLVFSLLFAKK